MNIVQLITVATESMASRGAVIEIKHIFLVNGGVWYGNWALPTVGISCVTSGTRTSKLLLAGSRLGSGVTGLGVGSWGSMSIY